MIGIQTNTTLNFEGKVTGAILNKNWLTGPAPTEIMPLTHTLTGRIVIKDVEVLDPTTSVPKAEVKMIFIVDKAGNLIIPKKRPSVLGFINTNYKYYLVFGLSHENGSSEVNLYAEFRRRTDEGVKTRYNLMYWQSPDFEAFKNWDVQYHAIATRIANPEGTILHACAIADGTDINDIHIQVAAESAVDRSLTLFKSRIMGVPETKEAIGEFYDTVSQLYVIENARTFDELNSPSYVDGVPDTSDDIFAVESQIASQTGEINEINKKLDAVVVSTTSRFVSR